MAQAGKLVSVNVGLPKEIEWRGQRVYTGIWKHSVGGTRAVRRLNVEGDGQGDLGGHGGENRAVFVYQTSAYEFWARKLKRSDFSMGQFGENFTVDGLPDDDVRIGDRYRVGTALFEVSQPRVTCYRVGIRMNDARMPAMLVSEGRPGFYLRVLEEGNVTAGDSIELMYRAEDSVTVADVDTLLYRPNGDRDTIRKVLQIGALSTGWRGSLQAILDQPPGTTGNPGLAPTGLSPAARPGFKPATIASLSRATADVFSIGLEAADGSPLDPPQPGQFIVLKIAASESSPEVMRSYSLCGAPNAKRYELGVKCEPGGSMGRYLSEARIGDRVEISAPRGTFVLRESERPVAFISAGIGITPVLAMLKSLAAGRSQRKIWWLYGARNSAEHPFAAQVRTLLSGLPNAQHHFRYSRPADADLLERDFDSTGHIDAALVERLGISTDSEFYLCGPTGFLREMKAGLAAAGIPSERVFSEAFGSGPALNPGIVKSQASAPHAPAGAAGTGPLVSFARSGLSIPWSTAYPSLLDFADACDVPARWSCRTGVCHTCESGLISGEVHYEPPPIQPPADGNVLICCAIPRSEVVLDL
jgi:ferredoxin-NADP reductase/MOSC domain-containing protein YiiM